MQWRIINRNDKNSYVDAVSIDREGFEYHGFMKDFQPHGIGALYKDKEFVTRGFWEDGLLSPENVLSQEEYDKEMNKIFN